MDIFMNNPEAIEDRSMVIIEESRNCWTCRLRKGRSLRELHTTGDTSYGGLLRIHPEALVAGLTVIRGGCSIITDVNMIKAGINQRLLEALGIKVSFYINDPQVVEEAQREGVTRAIVSMRHATTELDGGIAVIGNAPTALVTLCNLIKQEEVAPALVIGVPVGFVGAKESKELLMSMSVPYITVPGTKGGSAIAVFVVNALLKLA